MKETNKMNLETSFNLLVRLARANKLTYDEHQKVTEAIEMVMSALNKNNSSAIIDTLDEEE
tara:strand:+ start:27 stop:209 length:183 start_codon:yes stop_codon:yes gene_type:complete